MPSAARWSRKRAPKSSAPSRPIIAVGAPARAAAMAWLQPLPPRNTSKPLPDERLARLRAAGRPHDEVHHEAAEHGDAGAAHAGPSSRAPSAPPGWCSWKSSGPKPLATIRAMASASPTTAVTAVDAVGTRSYGSALALDADVDHRVGQLAQHRAAAAAGHGDDRDAARLHHRARTARPRACCPTSRWRGARRPARPSRRRRAAHRRRARRTAGVPVLARVAASLAPTRPDLPSPVTTTRPVRGEQQLERGLDVRRSGRPPARPRRAACAIACCPAAMRVGGTVAHRSSTLRHDALAGDLVDVDLPRVVVALALDAHHA